ncbi:MAG: hypothetical protein LKJ17_12110 [Oscillospiraceae bacterium]|nr:hypothetical protein [Oscillospiraceae bacterium]
MELYEKNSIVIQGCGHCTALYINGHAVDGIKKLIYCHDAASDDGVELTMTVDAKRFLGNDFFTDKSAPLAAKRADLER